jgi:catechol 2,3-dioxygenase-like lactoylglutathione lyase family enzyme
MAGQETHCIGSSDKPAWSKPSTFSLTRIDHVALNVADAESSARWYRDRYGFTVLHAWTDPTILMIGKGNIRMGLFEKKGAAPVKQPGRYKIIQHFAFSVDADQFQAVVDSYRRDGIDHYVEDTGVAWSVWTRDPDNFRVEVTSYYFPVTPKPGE